MSLGRYISGALFMAIIAMHAQGRAAEEGLLEATYGGGAGPCHRVLVVYGSRSGSTAEVADAIGKTLAGPQIAVDVRPAVRVKDIGPYEAVVIGSAIRAGRVLGEVSDFVGAHRGDLQKRRIAYFVVCMTMKDDTQENRKKVDAYLDPLRNLVASVDAGLFAGKMDYSKLGFADRFIVKRFAKVPEGDFRDWKAIGTWATGLRPKLKLM